MEGSKDETFLRKAIELAYRAGITEKTGGCFGAVVTKDDEIIAEGYNHVYADDDATAHAEVIAVRNAGKALGTWDLSDCVLYSSCEPCPLCTAAIYWAGVKKVYYAASDSDIGLYGAREKKDPFHGGEHAKPPGERKHIPFEQKLREEGRSVFKKFAELQSQ